MKWIDVNTDLPELTQLIQIGNKRSDEVLVTDGEGWFIAVLEAIRPTFERTEWIDPLTYDEIYGVTHWMPLPQIPEVDEQN